MSKKSKTRASEERKKAKQRAKAAQSAKYEAWKLAGQNSKSKRSVLRGKRSRSAHGKHEHRVADCGNVGCRKCFPRVNVMHAHIHNVIAQRETVLSSAH